MRVNILGKVVNFVVVKYCKIKKEKVQKVNKNKGGEVGGDHNPREVNKYGTLRGFPHSSPLFHISYFH